MNDKDALFMAIQSGQNDKVTELLNSNPDLVKIKDSRGFTPLIFASYFDKEDIVKTLVEHHAPIDAADASGNTALIGVSFKGNGLLANYLIQNNADVNAKNTNGTTPFLS